MRGVLILAICSTILFLTLFPRLACAGRAGVGVINVSPKYRSIRITQGEGMVKVYLTISDYNSWRDIYQVDLWVKNRGTTTAHFRFKHYEGTNLYDEINEFYELDGDDYLLLSQCSASHSSSDESVDDKCLLNVVFAFNAVPRSTRLLVITYDRGGLWADASIEYSTAAFRSGNLITPFWMDSPIKIPSDLLDAIAISLASTLSAIMIVRRREG